MCEPQEPLFCFLTHSLSTYSDCHQFNPMPNILLITMSLYNHTEKSSDLIAVKKERIESLDALPVCISVVLITRSDAICQYALSATLVTGHLLPGVLLEGPQSGCSSHGCLHMALTETGTQARVCSHQEDARYNTETSLQGAVVLITSKLF